MLKNLTKTLCLVGFACLVTGCMSARNKVTRNAIVATSNAPNSDTELAYVSLRGGAMQAYVTGYSFWDNTPPGSAQIARPVIHGQAGGTGTYHDPITVAVGHSKSSGHSRMDFPAGTRFYFPNLQKYGIVEDLCGDGPNPQNGPCHSGYGGLAWLDVYVGGRSVGASAADQCMNAITGVQDVLMTPPAGLPVRAGEVALSNCRGI